jgi:hypothetical protein
MLSEDEINHMNELKKFLDSGKKASAFLRLKSGEQAVMQFVIMAAAPHEEDRWISEERPNPTKKIRFTVKNLTDDPTGELEQTFEATKTTANKIFALLAEGFTTLKVKREGSGKEDTDYIVTPQPV